jgi:hypothetical protein
MKGLPQSEIKVTALLVSDHQEFLQQNPRHHPTRRATRVERCSLGCQAYAQGKRLRAEKHPD